MNRLTLASIGCLLLALCVNTAEAHPRKHAQAHKHVVVVERDVVRPGPLRSALALSIGTLVSALPRDYRRVVHNGRDYYFHDGVFYQRHARGYVVVTPARGLRLASLPASHTTVRVNGELLYRYRDVNYRRVGRIFVVV